VKDQIVKELNALAQTGIRNTSFVIEAVREGQFDEDINELSAVSVSEATDLIIDLAELRGIRV